MKFGFSGKNKNVGETKMLAQASSGSREVGSVGNSGSEAVGAKSAGIDVEKRREEILARGRKFKYPLQYAKHRVVINTILVGLVAVIGLVAVGYLELYKWQDMGDIMYRISTVIPVPVAEIEGEKVRFSDYLRTARSSLRTLGQQAGLEGENSETDLEAVKKQYKRNALDQAEDAAYALKLGKELGVEVSEEEISAAFDEHRRVGGTERSEESFLKVLEANFGLNEAEYRRMLYLALMRAKVEQEIDAEANKVAGLVEKRLEETGGDFAVVAAEFEGRVALEDTGGLIDNKNVDGGRSGKASSLEPGQMSGKFLSSNGDGYYFVKTVAKEERKVHYVSLYVEFTEFEKRLTGVRENELVKEYIDLE